MTLEEVRFQMLNYEEKREKLALLLMELHHILRSIEEQSKHPKFAFDGTMFRFDIIDRVIVEAYSIIKSEPTIIGVLDTLKKRLMLLNSRKEQLIATIIIPRRCLKAKRTGCENALKDSMSEVTGIADQIARTLMEKFGVESPYKTMFDQVQRVAE